MKKILIITYYWPPKGGVGVQRWLKLAKYISKSSCHPIIYTPENGVSSLEDKSLLETISDNITVMKRKIFEPQIFLSLLKRNLIRSDILIKKDNNFIDRLFIWFRSNFFVPDSRSYWIKPSIKFLDNYLKENPVDIIISTGPPHSTHMIALSLRNKFNIKWIADFRDPWTGIEYFEKLPLLSWIKKKHYRLERKVLSHADLVLTVSPSWANQFKKNGAKKITVLTNGYDPDDYQNPLQKSKSSKFIIGHFGLYNQMRDHVFFWETINQICKNNLNFYSDLNLLFAGEVYSNFFSTINKYKLDKKITYHSYLNHRIAIEKMMQCNLLLVTQGDTKSVDGRLPAKLFEYLGARKPILAIGKKNSDLEKIVADISYAWFVDFNNAELLKNTLIKIYEISKGNNIFNDDISHFSREKQAFALMNLINDL